MISAVIEYEDRSLSLYSSPSVYTGTSFPKGFYEARTSDSGQVYINRKEILEEHLPYYQEGTLTVLKTIKAFFNPDIEGKVRNLGFIHKLGILLHGRQGTGKTSLMNYMARYLLNEKNAVVFFCNDRNQLETAIGIASDIREIQDTPIVFISDEFERFADQHESYIKNFLDGKDSINNTLFLAATNYLERVPETLKNRPSRFKVVNEIKGFTDKKTIKSIITDISNKLNPGLFSEKEINKIVEANNDITIDEIKHFCLDKLTDNFVPDRESKPIGFGVPRLEDKDKNKIDKLMVEWKEVLSPSKGTWSVYTK